MASNFAEEKPSLRMIAALHPERLDGITSLRDEIADVISGKKKIKVSEREKKRLARMRNPFQAPPEILQSRAHDIVAGRARTGVPEARRESSRSYGIAAAPGVGAGGVRQYPTPLKEADPEAYREKLIEKIGEYVRDLGVSMESYFKEALGRLRWPAGPARPAATNFTELDTSTLERIERMAYRDHRKGTA